MLRNRAVLLSRYALIVAMATLQVAIPTQTLSQEAQPAMPSYEAIFRVPIPEMLPDHPRVFCTAEEIARIKADLAAGDVYTGACVQNLTDRAQSCLNQPLDLGGRKPSRQAIGDAAVLAQAYILTDNRKFGERARDMLLAFADICPTLETTPSAGRFTDSTLIEGPVAVDLAMAYDLLAAGDILTADERANIEQDLLRVIAWECGHGCGHRDSSNWRSWALTIVASCGFAIGDRELIEEAINGIYDPTRKAYLYGIVQQLTHSVFSDGIHWERSIGYTYYTASALMYVMEAAKNSGIDLWHAKLPGLLGPFEGSAGHEEYGPAGDRSIKAFLDAPFYYAFADGSFAQVGDSGSSQLGYHPIYELAYAEYRDPKYAWLINTRRSDGGQAPSGWSLWRARGNPQGESAPDQGRDGSGAFRLTTPSDARVALVQNVAVPAGIPTRVSGWVRALSMDGGSAHIRANFDGKETLFSNRVTTPGDWQKVTIAVPPREGAGPDDIRSIRLHVFLEGGAGEVLWDDISVHAGDEPRNLVRNPGFEGVATDGRRVSFWDLLNSPKQVPAGEYSLAKDATIGISGRHENGCTLFPVGGFAILREDATDLDAPAVNLTYGPYGSGHDHPDRLHFDLYALGKVLCPDAGSWGYDNPMHLTWANQSIAHNTLTVDEVAQAPQGKSKSIWASERADQRVFGVLRLFHPGEELKAVRATCDTAYPGVMMDRTLCLVDGYVLDVFRATSDSEHTYDLAFHGPGQVSTVATLDEVTENPWDAWGYNHLTAIRRGTPSAGVFRADFTEGENSLMLLQVQPEGGELILAKDPKKRADTSACIARRKATSSTWVTVLEPHKGAPRVASVSTAQEDGALVVTVTHAGGADRFTLTDALVGGIDLVREGTDGAVIASEKARAGS